MIDTILTLKTNHYLLIFLMSMLPITELRLSIPYGILFFNKYYVYVYLISVIVNIMIGCIALYILPPIFHILKKNKVLNNIIESIINHSIRIQMKDFLLMAM